jgi:predicted phage terminase large subunit-like protein
MESRAALMLSELERERPEIVPLEAQPDLPGLMDWMPLVTPRYQRPEWLQPVVDIVESAVRRKRLKAVVHTPPRHGKTETWLHGIVYGLHKDPTLSFGYASYNSTIAHSKAGLALALAEQTKLPLLKSGMHEWQTYQRGGALFVGVREGLTGMGINCLGVVDDPIKDRLEAESATYRERTHDWFKDVFLTRLEKNASCVINMARWHPDDLAARYIKLGWDYICLPAIREIELPDGTFIEEALCENLQPLELLREKRTDVGEYTWASLFMGQPRPRGGSVFGDPLGWSALPMQHRAGIGLDFAYARTTSKDWSVIVVMLHWAGLSYVVDVVRVQRRAPAFLEIIRAYKSRYPTARMRWYASGTEAHAADFALEAGIAIEVIPARGDKYTRAIGYAAGWNAGQVLVPEDSARYPWVNKFIEEHVNFTGEGAEQDDQVDSAVAAYDVVTAAEKSSYDDSPSGGVNEWS